MTQRPALSPSPPAAHLVVAHDEQEGLVEGAEVVTDFAAIMERVKRPVRGARGDVAVEVQYVPACVNMCGMVSGCT